MNLTIFVANIRFYTLSSKCFSLMKHNCTNNTYIAGHLHKRHHLGKHLLQVAQKQMAYEYYQCKPKE